MDDIKPGKAASLPPVLPPAQRRATNRNTAAYRLTSLSSATHGQQGQKPSPLDQASSFDPRQTAFDIGDAGSSSPQRKSKKSRKGRWAIIISVVLLLVLAAAAVGAKVWYDAALEPVAGQEDSERVRITIDQGATSAGIATLLKHEGLIQSELAFRILVKQTGKLADLQAGQYLLSPAQSSRHILDVIAGGKVDTYNVTIVPGLTLSEIKQRLVKDGFTKQDVEAAFMVQYDHPLLADKPANTSLEGYIFPDTYQVTSQTTVQQLLVKSFDRFEQLVQQQGLRAKLAAHNLDMYQGITLASIVQKEVSDASVQQQVAQVFFKRLATDMELGSDVTFMYAAKQLGVPESVDLDSPYNTRRYKGLPPGPIANFNISALQAVATPAEGEYVYFVAGDDGTTYFSNTLQEHEAAVREHCTKLCQ